MSYPFRSRGAVVKGGAIKCPKFRRPSGAADFSASEIGPLVASVETCGSLELNLAVKRLKACKAWLVLAMIVCGDEVSGMEVS